MHIALFCPFSQGPTRGNITSVQRIARHLQIHGLQTDLIPLDATDLHLHLQNLVATPPSLLHGFHAFHAGPLTRTTAQQLGLPYLITLTGSDLFDPALRDQQETRLALHDAAAVTCFDPLVAKLAMQAFPHISPKLHVIPQGVESFQDTKPTKKPSDSFVILLPAALRPVKGIDFAIDALSPLTDELPQLQLWIAGGELDHQYAATVREQAAQLAWVKFLGEVPYQSMGALYAAADLVLNSSQFEGGMANALLEAMVMGKPVVARDVPGNRSLILHGETGWLFQGGEELCRLISQLMAHKTLRDTVAAQAQQHVLAQYSPQREAGLLAQLYRSLRPAQT
ncbi:MAG: glycosyltransferase family 4 protein [Geobacteraceae bacterium]|nr:glycosyltransferase family 4 protein [Geobacteraceae bacterium]